jgi:hypothetical protein
MAALASSEHATAWSKQVSAVARKSICGASERARRLWWAARERTAWPSIDDELLLFFI